MFFDLNFLTQRIKKVKRLSYHKLTIYIRILSYKWPLQYQYYNLALITNNYYLNIIHTYLFSVEFIQKIYNIIFLFSFLQLFQKSLFTNYFINNVCYLVQIIRDVSKKQLQQQMSNKTYFFTNFLQKIAEDDSIYEFIAYAEEHYHIKAYLIKDINPDQAKRLYDSINSKFYKNSNHSKCSNWFENELRLFAWVVVCYCHLNNKKIQMLGNDDWAFFLKIFQHKDPRLFEYQCHCFYLDNKNKNWQRDQQNLLKQIMNSHSIGHTKIKWNQVSKELFQLSNKYFLRTPKQCRQRWNNHLDPSKVKGNWKLEQYVKMFEYVKKHGKKWASLVKVLDNVRNEHSIKNKFNSMVKKHEKLKRQDKKQLTQEQLYTQIIAKVQSALRNTKNGHQRADLDFDYEEEQIKPQKKSIQQKKCPSFAEKLMQKLRKFGSEASKKSQQVKQEQKIKPTKIKQSKSIQQKEQKISYSNNSLEDQLQQDSDEENQNYDNYNQNQDSRMMEENIQLRKINDSLEKQKNIQEMNLNIQQQRKQQIQIVTSKSLSQNRLNHNFINQWPSVQEDRDDEN